MLFFYCFFSARLTNTMESNIPYIEILPENSDVKAGTDGIDEETSLSGLYTLSWFWTLCSGQHTEILVQTDWSCSSLHFQLLLILQNLAERKAKFKRLRKINLKRGKLCEE